jgi:EAL domain-containing protein (putative c-di-GMP-specific phosphodiesterase class I)
MQLGKSPVGKELLDIFQKQSLTPVFQPIMDLKQRRVFAHEALIRGPKNSFLHNPINLLKAAEDHGCLFEIDWLARLLSIHSFQHQQADDLLFLNVTVNTLLQKTHRSGITLEYLQLLGISIDKVVIEITELQPVEDFRAFVESVEHYRKMGFKVAIDDLGAGYNGLRIWSEIRPDFVKIDHHFISNIHNDSDKYRFMNTICSLANNLNTKIVAEGIEQYGELHVLEKLGVDYVQGFLFKRPQETISSQVDFEWCTAHHHLGQPKTHFSAANLLQEPFVINTTYRVMQIARFLFANPDIGYIPVIINDRIHGMIWREQIMSHVAKTLEYFANPHTDLMSIIDTDVALIPIDTSLVDMANIITSHHHYKQNTAFIITENGHYKGCGLLSDLLELLLKHQ